jgi:hypothetical protein
MGKTFPVVRVYAFQAEAGLAREPLSWIPRHASDVLADEKQFAGSRVSFPNSRIYRIGKFFIVVDELFQIVNLRFPRSEPPTNDDRSSATPVANK